MHKNWNAIVEFSVRKKFLLSRKIIIMQKVFFVLVLELDGFFQKFCIVPRDIHIECSKQFKWNLYFYVSGQSRPFWAALKPSKFKYEI